MKRVPVNLRPILNSQSMDFSNHKLQSIYTDIISENTNLFRHLGDCTSCSVDSTVVTSTKSRYVYPVNDEESREMENQEIFETNRSTSLSSTFTENTINNQINSLSLFEELTVSNIAYDEDEIFKRILDKLYIAYQDLSPVIDEIINSAHEVAAPHVDATMKYNSPPVCSVTEEQFKTLIKASKLVEEVNNEVILNAKYNIDLLKGDVVHFPVANFIVNTAHQILDDMNTGNSKGTKNNRIFIERNVADQLIELQSLLHDALQQFYEVAKKKQLTAEEKLKRPSNATNFIEGAGTNESNISCSEHPRVQLEKLQEEYQGLSDTVEMLKSIIQDNTSGSVSNVRNLGKSYRARKSKSDNSLTTDVEKSKKVTDINGARRCILECLMELAEVRKYLTNIDDDTDELDMINQIRLTGHSKTECCSRQDVPHLHAKLNGIPIVVKLNQETLDSKISSVENKYNEECNGFVEINDKHTCVASTSTPIIKSSDQSTNMISADKRKSTRTQERKQTFSRKSIISARSSKSYSYINEKQKKPKNKTLSKRGRNSANNSLLLKNRRSLTQNSRNRGDFFNTYPKTKIFVSDMKTFLVESSTSINEKIPGKLKTTKKQSRRKNTRKKLSPFGKINRNKVSNGHYTLKYNGSGKLLEMTCHMKNNSINHSRKEAIVIRLESLERLSIQANLSKLLKSSIHTNEKKIVITDSKTNNTSQSKTETSFSNDILEKYDSYSNVSSTDSTETVVDNGGSKENCEGNSDNRSCTSVNENVSLSVLFEAIVHTTQRDNASSKKLSSDDHECNSTSGENEYQLLENISQTDVKSIYNSKIYSHEWLVKSDKTKNLEMVTLTTKDSTSFAEEMKNISLTSTIASSIRESIYTPYDLTPIIDIEEEPSESSSEITVKSTDLITKFIKSKEMTADDAAKTTFDSISCLNTTNSNNTFIICKECTPNKSTKTSSDFALKPILNKTNSDTTATRMKESTVENSDDYTKTKDELKSSLNIISLNPTSTIESEESTADESTKISAGLKSSTNTTTKDSSSSNIECFPSTTDKCKLTEHKSNQLVINNFTTTYKADDSSKSRIPTSKKHKYKHKSSKKEKSLTFISTKTSIPLLEKNTSSIKVLFKQKQDVLSYSESGTISTKSSTPNMYKSTKPKLLPKHRDKHSKCSGDSTSNRKNSYRSGSVTETGSDPNIPYVVSIRSIPSLNKDKIKAHSKLPKRKIKKRSRQVDNQNFSSRDSAHDSYLSSKSYVSLPYPVSLMSLPADDIDALEIIKNKRKFYTNAIHKAAHSNLEYYSNLERNIKRTGNETYEVRYFEVKDFVKDKSKNDNQNSHQQTVYASAADKDSFVPNFMDYSNSIPHRDQRTFEVRVFEFTGRGSKGTPETSHPPSILSQKRGSETPPQLQDGSFHKSRFYNYPGENEFSSTTSYKKAEFTSSSSKDISEAFHASSILSQRRGSETPSQQHDGNLHKSRFYNYPGEDEFSPSTSNKKASTDRRQNSITFQGGHGSSRLGAQPWAPFVASDVSLPHALGRSTYPHPHEEDKLPIRGTERSKVIDSPKYVQTDHGLTELRIDQSPYYERRNTKDQGEDPIIFNTFPDETTVKDSLKATKVNTNQNEEMIPLSLLKKFTFIPNSNAEAVYHITHLPKGSVTVDTASPVEFQLPQKGPRSLIDASTSYHKHEPYNADDQHEYFTSLKATTEVSQQASLCTCKSKKSLTFMPEQEKSIKCRLTTVEKNEVSKKQVYRKPKSSEWSLLNETCRCDTLPAECKCGTKKVICSGRCDNSRRVSTNISNKTHCATLPSKASYQKGNSKNKKAAGNFNPQVMFYINDQLNCPLQNKTKHNRFQGNLQHSYGKTDFKNTKTNSDIQEIPETELKIRKDNFKADGSVSKKSQTKQYCITSQVNLLSKPSIDLLKASIIDSRHNKTIEGEHSYAFRRPTDDNFYFLCVSNKSSITNNKDIVNNNVSVGEYKKVSKTARKQVHHNTLLNYHTNQQHCVAHATVSNHNRILYSSKSMDNKSLKIDNSACVSQESIITNTRSSLSTIELPKSIQTSESTHKYLDNRPKKEFQLSSATTFEKSQEELHFTLSSLSNIPQKYIQDDININHTFGAKNITTELDKCLKYSYTVGTNTDFIANCQMMQPAQPILPVIQKHSKIKCTKNGFSNNDICNYRVSLDNTKIKWNFKSMLPKTSSSTVTVLNLCKPTDSVLPATGSKGRIQFENPYVYEVHTKNGTRKSSSLLRKLEHAIVGIASKRGKKRTHEASAKTHSKNVPTSKKKEKNKICKKSTKSFQTPNKFYKRRTSQVCIGSTHIMGSNIELDQLKGTDTYRVIISHLSDACTQSLTPSKSLELNPHGIQSISQPLSSDKKHTGKCSVHNKQCHFHYTSEAVPSTFNKCTQSPPVTFRSKVNESSNCISVYQLPKYISEYSTSYSSSGKYQPENNEKHKQRLDDLFDKKKRYISWDKTVCSKGNSENPENQFSLPNTHNINYVKDNAFTTLAKVKSTTRSSRSSCSYYNENKIKFQCRDEIVNRTQLQNYEREISNIYQPFYKEQRVFHVHTNNRIHDKAIFKDADEISGDQILAIHKNELEHSVCKSNVQSTFYLEKKRDPVKNAKDIACKPTKLASCQSMCVVRSAFNNITSQSTTPQTSSDNNINITNVNQAHTHPITVQETVYTCQADCQSSRRKLFRKQEKQLFEVLSMKDNQKGRQELQQKQTSHECQLVSKESGANTSKPEKVCWALTRVKTRNDGSKDFEILETSAIPPGHFLISNAHSLILLGNKPYVYTQTQDKKLQ